MVNSKHRAGGERATNGERTVQQRKECSWKYRFDYSLTIIHCFTDAQSKV
jgi:hypothetical protein